VRAQNWIATYGRALRVPAGSLDDARIGAEVLSVSCIVCHQVRGVGGTRGPPLSDAATRRDPAGFTTRMRDHLARVSGLRSAPETSAAAAREVAAFLRAVEVAGTRTEEEVQPPEPPEPLPPLPDIGRSR